MKRTCYGCDAIFPSFGGLLNHARNSDTCTEAMRFWGKVVRSGECWLWIARKQPDGYGQLNHNGKTVNSHKHVYEMFNGQIPAGMEVMHSCHVRHCVNPAHMSLGTHAENVGQTVAARRHTFGERSGRNKLTEDQVKEIKANPPKMGRGGNVTEYAKRYGVGYSAIYAILRGHYWRHVQ